MGEGNEPGDRHRPLHHRRQWVADFHLVDIARAGTTDLLGFVERKDFHQIVARIESRLPGFGLDILRPPFSCGVAFRAKAPAIPFGDQVTVLIVKFRPVNLLEVLMKGSTLNRFLQEVRDAAVQVVPLDQA